MQTPDYTFDDLDAAYGRCIGAYDKIDVPPDDPNAMRHVSALMRAAFDFNLKTQRQEQLNGAISALRVVERTLERHPYAHHDPIVIAAKEEPADVSDAIPEDMAA